MLEKLKRELLELLEADVEFRYAVAGRLGILEVLRRLDGIEADIKGLWEEVKGLREDQRRLWEGQDRLWRSHERLWEELKALREDQRKLWESHERLWKYVKTGFSRLQRSLGASFEDYAASFVELLLSELGYVDVEVGRKELIHGGKIVEVNLFCEKPLVVGEATVYIDSVEEARSEVERLLEKAKAVEEEVGRKPAMLILAVANAPSPVVEALRELAEEHGIKLALGREVREFFAPEAPG